MGDQPSWMRQHSGTVRSLVWLRQQEVLLFILQVVNHRVFCIQCLHAMQKYIFIFGIHPTILLRDDLLYRCEAAIESFVEVMQVVLHIQLMPALQVQSL